MDWVKTRPLSVRFIELMQTGDNTKFFKNHHIRGEALRYKLEESGWSEQKKEKNSGPATVFQHPDYLGNIALKITMRLI